MGVKPLSLRESRIIAIEFNRSNQAYLKSLVHNRVEGVTGEQVENMSYGRLVGMAERVLEAARENIAASAMQPGDLSSDRGEGNRYNSGSGEQLSLFS